MEAPNTPRRDLKVLWLLPILALGVGTLIATRKPPSSDETGKHLTRQRMRAEVYRHTTEIVSYRIIESHPQAALVLRFAPYTGSEVTELGQDRFRCAGAIQARTRSGAALRERWQCVISIHHGYWMCEDFRQTPLERVSPGPTEQGAGGGGNAGP